MKPSERARRHLQADAFLQLTRLHRVLARHLERGFADAGFRTVTPAQANVLLVLFQAGRPMTAREVADELALSDVTVGRFVKALEHHGWVTRTRDPRDSRARLIAPTPQAHDQIPRFAAISNATLDAAFGDCDDAEIRDIITTLSALRAHLGPNAPDPTPVTPRTP